MTGLFCSVTVKIGYESKSPFNFVWPPVPFDTEAMKIHIRLAPDLKRTATARVPEFIIESFFVEAYYDCIGNRSDGANVAF